MPKPIKIVLILILFLVVMVGLILANPELVARPLLQSQLAKANFRLIALESVYAGAESASVAVLRAESPSFSLSATNIQLSYTLSGLLIGEVTTIEIDSLAFNIKDSGSGGDVIARADSTARLPDLYESVANLPLEELTIKEASIRSPLGSLDTRLNFQSRPLSLTLAGQWQGTDTLDILVASEAAADNQILVSSSVSQESMQLFEGDHSLELSDSGLFATGRLSLDANNLQAALLSTQQPDSNWAVLNNNMQLEYRVALNTSRTAPLLESLRITLSNEGDASDRSLQVQGQTLDASYLARIGLPLSLDVTPNSANEWYGVVLTDSYHNLSWYNGENQVHVEANLSGFRANCETWNHCVSSADFQLHSPAWEFIGASGENTSISGELDIELLPDLIELNGNNVTLAVDSAHYEQWHGAGSFQVDQVFLILGEVDRGRVRLSSNSLNIESDELGLVDPRIATNINFFDQSLAGSFDLALGASGNLDSPLLHSSFNHSLSNFEGRMTLNLNETEFTESEPLSGLIRQQWLNMDVVAGKIAGTGELYWELVDGEFQLGGPATVSLDALSGHVEDTLFLGVNTNARGEFYDWTEFISAPGLTASIDVVDIGLPARNVQWRYSFNTAEQEILINELNSELFDGKVEIADFRIDPDNLDQDLTLVLSRMSLESIVGLAGYPQLFVDGLISGYIPISLAGGKILINDGLVGALRPGGNIRYTPTASAAVNQTMQLVNDALSNYKYETLDTRVFYDENGDLRMEVQLQGINPDMNGGQPINLNVNVTDNIPSLLRSLKAGQEISERLEQHLQSR